VTDLLMGIPGAGRAHPGIHVCALFSGLVERDRLLVQFLREGLRHGDQCACLMDDLEPVSVREEAYRPAGVGDTRRPGHLGMYSAPDAYLHSGALSPRQRVVSLVSDPASPQDRGLPLLRAAGQMPTDSSHEPGTSDFSTYESAVILILSQVPTVFLCLYDMRHFGVGMLADVLKVHSRVLLDGTVLYNPQTVLPTDCSETRIPWRRPPAGHVEEVDPWALLTDAESRIAGLVGGGMTNRATAQELIVSPHTVDAHLKHIYQKLSIHSRTELAVLTFHHASAPR
jgi:DNA-binding CsgD family transcriptional regulator